MAILWLNIGSAPWLAENQPAQLTVLCSEFPISITGAFGRQKSATHYLFFWVTRNVLLVVPSEEIEKTCFGASWASFLKTDKYSRPKSLTF